MNRTLLCLALLAAAVVGQGAPPASASSHREAPLISEDPLADNTDVYAFVSPADPTKVTLVANFVPLQAPYGGPNFFRFGDDVLYEIKVDNDGDALEDITFQFRFNTITRNGNTFLYNTGVVNNLTDQTLNRPQFYSVTIIRGRRQEPSRRPGLTQPPARPTTVLGTGLIAAPSNVGPKSMPNYAALAAQAIYNLGNGIKVFVGQRDDPFFVDLGGVFDGPLNIRSPGLDKLAGFNVNTIAIEVPKTLLTRNGTAPTSATDPAAVIGVWSTASRPSIRVLSPGQSASGGDFVQVSRLGMPLVNEVLIPLALKDRFNTSQPVNDAQFRRFFEDPEPSRLLQAGALTLNGAPVPVKVPPTPRNEFVAVFLTGVPGLNQPPGVKPAEMLRLNVAIPPSATPKPLGVLAGDLAGFPNGRRLADDVVDIEVRVLAGVLVQGFNVAPNNIIGDFIDKNDVPFLNTFPYVGIPHHGFEVD